MNLRQNAFGALVRSGFDVELARRYARVSLLIWRCTATTVFCEWAEAAE